MSKNKKYFLKKEKSDQLLSNSQKNKNIFQLKSNTFEQLKNQNKNPELFNNFFYNSYEENSELLYIKNMKAVTSENIKLMTLDVIFDLMSICLNVEKAAGKKIVVNFNIKDTKEKYILILENCVLLYSKNNQVKNPDATIVFKTRNPFDNVIAGIARFDDQVSNGKIIINGNYDKVMDLFNMYDCFKYFFNTITA